MKRNAHPKIPPKVYTASFENRSEIAIYLQSDIFLKRSIFKTIYFQNAKSSKKCPKDGFSLSGSSSGVPRRFGLHCGTPGSTLGPRVACVLAVFWPSCFDQFSARSISRAIYFQNSLCMDMLFRELPVSAAKVIGDFRGKSVGILVISSALGLTGGFLGALW